MNTKEQLSTQLNNQLNSQLSIKDFPNLINSLELNIYETFNSDDRSHCHNQDIDTIRKDSGKKSNVETFKYVQTELLKEFIKCFNSNSAFTANMLGRQVGKTDFLLHLANELSKRPNTKVIYWNTFFNVRQDLRRWILSPSVICLTEDVDNNSKALDKLRGCSNADIVLLVDECYHVIERIWDSISYMFNSSNSSYKRVLFSLGSLR